VGIWTAAPRRHSQPLTGFDGDRKAECLAARGLERRGERPFRRRQAAALALERLRGHAGAIRNAAGLHRGAAGRATRLGVEIEKGHAFVGHTVDIRRRHAAARAAAIDARVAIAEIV